MTAAPLDSRTVWQEARIWASSPIIPQRRTWRKIGDYTFRATCSTGLFRPISGRRFLITHPIADVDSHNLIRWTPGSPLSGKSIAISGSLFSNPGGNGVSIKLVNWKDEQTPVDLDVLYLKQGRQGTSAIESEFVVHINPDDLGRHVDMAIGNNGSYICDATALELRVYAADEPYETPGVDVTKRVQSVFQGKFRTDLGKYADLFGDPAPGQEKTLKLQSAGLGW